MKYGLLYPFCNWLFSFLNHFTVYEWFKCFGAWLGKRNPKAAYIVSYKRAAGDIFILLKWGFMLVILQTAVANTVVSAVVWYLIITNLYTFFYTLVWKDLKFAMEDIWARRRFLNLLQAIAFNYFSFAYLYYLPYANDMQWNRTPRTFLHAFWYSVSNSVAGNYNIVTPDTDCGNSVSLIQFLIMFVFATILISKAIPDNTGLAVKEDVSQIDNAQV